MAYLAWWPWGGNAIETMDRMNDFPNHYLAVVANELGHAFALDPGQTMCQNLSMVLLLHGEEQLQNGAIECDY